ncbi:MAG: DNA cytosine methyltransferase, partial [Verrucomicrobiota bacterium]
MRSIELFSGAGGLALGLEAAGFDPVALVERNRDACATLRRNRPRWQVIETDVRDIDFRSFGEVDMVAGGPPCQPFSIGGKARGYDDTRDMFPQAVRAVRDLRPKAFLFENVRGLLRDAFSAYVEFVRLQLMYPEFPVSANVAWDANLQRLQKHHTSRQRLDGLTYQVSLHLADAADYGVPQRRHRVFFVGFRADVDAKWFFPTPTHSAAELLRAKWATGDYWREHG